MKKWFFIINLATAFLNVSNLTASAILYLFTQDSLYLLTVPLTAAVVALSILGAILAAKTEETTSSTNRRGARR